MSVEFEFCAALTKVRPGERPNRGDSRLSALLGENISFQVA